MSNFTPQVTKEYEFDGDTVKVTFSRLKRKDMMATLPAMRKLSLLRVNEDSEVTEEQTDVINTILDDLSDVVPNYITSIEGLTDTEGHPLGADIVMTDMYFMRLSALIIMDLIKESSLAMEGNA